MLFNEKKTTLFLPKNTIWNICLFQKDNKKICKELISIFFFPLQNCDKKSNAKILFRIRTNQLLCELELLLRLSAPLPLRQTLEHLPVFVHGGIAHHVGNDLKDDKNFLVKDWTKSVHLLIFEMKKATFAA